MTLSHKPGIRVCGPSTSSLIQSACMIEWSIFLKVSGENLAEDFGI